MIVIYKGGGGGSETCPPRKIFQTEMSFTAFSKKINVSLRLQNSMKISKCNAFYISAEAIMRSFFVKKAAIFLISTYKRT